MAGPLVPHVLVVICTIMAFNCVSTLPRDIFPTVDENHVENLEPIALSPSENTQLLKSHKQEDKPKNCFHFYVSRNMSSLLAEATKMLRNIRDRREREWILTFIYRIKSLAEHIRAHPDSRNYDCLPTDEESRKKTLNDNFRGQQQPELYFVDDVPKRSNDAEEISGKTDEVKAADNQDSNDVPASTGQSASGELTKQESDIKSSSSKTSTQSSAEIASDNTLTDSNTAQKDTPTLKQDETVTSQNPETDQEKDNNNETDKRKQSDEGSIVVSSVPDCSTKSECKNVQNTLLPEGPPETYFADAGNIYPSYQSDASKDQELSSAEYYQQEALKERLRKALLGELAPEMKKFKTVGGTEEDLMNLWNYVQDAKSEEEKTGADFDYEEIGAAAGYLNLNENVQPDRTVAPSLDEVQYSKENSNNGKDSSYEPYDDSDVLVQQLFDVRHNNPPSKTTKSLGDQNNEYLITSTSTPLN